MSTMMIMRNNLTTGSKHMKKKNPNNKPRHFVFPHNSSMQKTMNVQNLSMDKSHKKSHRQHQSFVSQDHHQEGSIIDSQRQQAHESGISANQPIISHYQRHSFIEEKIAEQNDDTNDYAFNQHNESSSLSPIKSKQAEPFVDEIRTMGKQAKKKANASAMEQKNGSRHDQDKLESGGRSQSNGSNSFAKPRSNVLGQVNSKSFNQNLHSQNSRLA